MPELQALGFKIVIFPGSIMLSVCTLAQRILREIRERGTTASLTGEMVSVVEFFDIMGLQDCLERDQRWAPSAAASTTDGLALIWVMPFLEGDFVTVWTDAVAKLNIGVLGHINLDLLPIMLVVANFFAVGANG